MKKLIIIIFIIVFAGLLIGIGWYRSAQTSRPEQALLSVQPTVEETGVLRVGENIDENGLAADQKEFQPFMDYLVKKLANQGFGLTKGEFVGTNSVSEMAQLVRLKKIDVVIDSPFPVYVVSTLAGALPLANRWKEGVEKYHSAIFVKGNSPLKSLDELKGKIIVMDSSTSTAGYFLPKAELIKRGYTLTQKSSVTDKVGANEIGYVFVGAKVYDDVANGVAAAGTESDSEIRAHFGNSFSQYRYIATTPDILRFLVAVSGEMDPKLRSAIKDILVNMDITEEGRKVLYSFANTAKFTPVVDSDQAYGVIKNLTDLVEAEIVRQ